MVTHGSVSVEVWFLLQAELLDGNQLLGIAPEEELEQREAGDLRARKAFSSDLRDLEVADPGRPWRPWRLPLWIYHGYTMDIPWIYHGYTPLQGDCTSRAPWGMLLKNADTVNKTEIGTLGTMQLTLTKHRRGTAVVEVDPRKPFTIYGWCYSGQLIYLPSLSK